MSLSSTTFSLTALRAGLRWPDCERLVWWCLLLLALLARLINLDARGMSHDESLHALYSFYLYERGEYVHDPMMHGPLLFHANALIYWLLGSTDFTTRLLPALAGTLAVGSMWWYRRYLGRIGALAAAGLLLVSPSLLFHSRYIRNDIYVVLFALIWIYCLFRYIENGRSQWMTGMGGAMILGFVSKENHFITGTIIGLFMAVMTLQALARPGARNSVRTGRLGDVSLVMLLLVLPFLTSFLLLILDRPVLPVTVPDRVLAGTVAGLLGLLGLGGGWLWFSCRPKAWQGPFGARQFAGLWLGFWITGLLFFSTFLTNPQGLLSGPVGSLGYWLEQQEVQRGSQPLFYYVMLMAIYEFLPFCLAIGGSVFAIRAGLAWRRSLRAARLLSHTPPLPITLLVPFFLIWWMVGAWLGYTYAGERMPWLFSHIAAPMCLLGGYGLEHFVRAVRGRMQPHWRPGLVLAGSLTCGGAMLALVPFAGRDLESIRVSMQWLSYLVAGLGLGIWSLRHLWRSRQALGTWFMLGLLVPLGLLTVRVSYQLNYVNFDHVTEYLMYAHASPDIKRLMTEIETLSRELHGNRDLQIAYDHDNSWPLAWYFREYPHAHIYDLENPDLDLLSAPIVLAGPSHWEAIRPYTERNYVRQMYRLIWWPEESYKTWTWQSFRKIWDTEARRHFQRVYFFREHPRRDLRTWPHQRDFAVYVRRDLAHYIWDETKLPADAMVDTPEALYHDLAFPAVDAIHGALDGLPLRDPRSVSLSDTGHLVITDSGNHRVLILNRAHEVLLSVGSHCPLENPSPDCRDPDGAGPLALGDGQFHEPWGAVLSSGRELLVADTWNHRIQVFNEAGHFRSKWGSFGLDASPQADGAYLMFGPRGLDLDPEGNLLVTDTGNHRLLRFAPDGSWLSTAGRQGMEPGLFHEPVGLAHDPGHDRLFVADTWNGRIQILSSDLQPQAEIRVPSTVWTLRDSISKPFVAYVPDYGIAVTDPMGHRVLFFALDGTLRGYIGHVSDGFIHSGMPLLPIGLAYDPVTRRLYVADAGNHAIHVYDLTGAAVSGVD